MQVSVFRRPWQRLSWAQQFLLSSFLIFIIGMVGVSLLIGEQIERGVVQQTAANTALYVSSVVEPQLQELATSNALAPEHTAELSHMLRDTSFGQQITTMKVWDRSGRVVFDTDTENIGRSFPIDDDLATALRGWVSAEIGNTNKTENVFDSSQGMRQLETYSPLRRTGTNEIIAAVEFYQNTEQLDRNIAAARQQSWLWIGVGTAALYLALAGFVQHGNATIQRQQHVLSEQVAQLSTLLAQNKELHTRVQRATRRTTAINERVLRRVSADLHDGPAQDLGYALLRLDQLRPGDAPDGNQHFEIIQQSLRHAMKEIRAISGGLGLPDLEHLSLAETAGRAVRAHERRTGTRVDMQLGELEHEAPLAFRITVYRLIQEALQNAFRHGGAAEQRVVLGMHSGQIQLEVSDQGPGFTIDPREWDGHLGLVGMRERVESLGGRFTVESSPGQGTRVHASLPLGRVQESHE